MIVGLEGAVADATNTTKTSRLRWLRGPLAVVDASRRRLFEEPLEAKFNILRPVQRQQMSRRAAEVTDSMHTPATHK